MAGEPATQEATAETFEQAVEAKVKDLARALDSPEAIARAVGAWVAEKYPERIGTGKWITVEGQRDTGMTVRFFRLNKSGLELGGLIGKETAGAHLSMTVWRHKGGASASLGIGVVSPYDNFGDKWTPAAVVSVRW